MLSKLFGFLRREPPAPVDRVTLNEARPLLSRWENGKMVPGHLEEYRDWMIAKGRTPKHAGEVYSRARKVIRMCRWRTIADVRAEQLELKVARVLKDRRGLGLKTCNDYLKAPSALTRWMSSPKVGRSRTNPLSDVEKYNAALDVRHPRRPLTKEEFLHILASVAQKGRTIKRMGAADRVMYYLLKIHTGLRNEEAASLTHQSFNLTDQPPTVSVQARHSKHRKADVLPLDPDVAKQLAGYLKSKPAGMPIFPTGDKPYLMWKQDVADAGLEYRDDAGFADLYALRHTFATELGRTPGTSIRVVQRLMRHCDIRITQRYMHVDNADEMRALASLPRLNIPNPEAGQ